MRTTSVNVQPWSGEQAPTEAAIRSVLEQERLRYYRWSNGPGDVYAAHTHSYHKVLYVVRGSITFGLPEEGRAVTLRAGDRMDLPPGVMHDAVVGPEGVVCLEGHQL